MGRAKLILSAAVPTVVALLGAAYVALAYYRASDVVERRATADVALARLLERARAWSPQLEALETTSLEPITRACAGRLASAEPAALITYLTPAAAPGRVGDELVGWSTFGLSALPLDRPLRPEPFSRIVLHLLANPGESDLLVWRRDAHNVPFVDRARWLAVARVIASQPQVRLAAAVYDLESGTPICAGLAVLVPRPRPLADPRAPSDLPPQFVTFEVDDQAARVRAIRFGIALSLCRTGGEQLCAHAAARF